MGPLAKLRSPLLLALLAAALVAAGCGDGDDGEEVAPAPAPTTTENGGEGEAAAEQDADEQAAKPERRPRPGTTIKAGDSQFGDVLFDGDEQAIYLFDKETSSKSECYGECAEAWPPVLTKGRPQAKGAISRGKLGTTQRDDGKRQVTYSGHPLYYYHDEGPTEVRCHNIPGFGGLWLALTPQGEPAPT